MNIAKNICAALCLALLSVTGFAQKVKVSSELDTNAIMIGQQFRMKVKVEQPANLSVIWPQWDDTITKGVEIVDMGKTDTTFSDNKDKITFTREYILTSFDSGAYTIPAFAFTATTGTVSENIFSNPLFIAVDKPAVDTTKGIRDIKGPVEIPFNWKEYLPYVLGGIGVVALIVVTIILVVRAVRRRKARRAAMPEPTAPPIPAHIRALGALDELVLKQLWQHGKTKEYYTELTDIFRDYISELYKINAPEMLTDEIVRHLKFKELTGEQKHVVKTVLELADMVKFAKVSPSTVENEQSLVAVTVFVQETALAEEKREKEKAEKAKKEAEKKQKEEEERRKAEEGGSGEH